MAVKYFDGIMSRKYYWFLKLFLLIFIILISKIDYSEEKCIFGAVNLTELNNWNWTTSNDINIYKIQFCQSDNSSSDSCSGSLVCMTSNSNYQLGALSSMKVNQSDKGEITVISQGAKCLENSNENYQSIIIIKCGTNLGFPEYLKKIDCVYYFEWHSYVACKTPSKLSEVPCYVLDSNKKVIDLSPLIKHKGAHLVQTTDKNSKMYINVCRYITEDSSTSGCNQSVCKINMKGDKVVNFGSTISPLKLDTNSITLNYTSSLQSQDCSREEFIIQFNCPTKDRFQSYQPLLIASRKCYHEILWDTDYACPATTLSVKNSCKIYKGTQVIDLSKLNSSSIYQAVDNQTKTTYDISVCGYLKKPCNNDTSNNVSVCQKTLSSGEKIGGRMNSSILRYADNELKLIYQDGEKCHHNHFSRSSIITFKCNRNISIGQPRFIEEDDCLYMFEWETQYVCVDEEHQDMCMLATSNGNIELQSLLRRNSDQDDWEAIDIQPEKKRYFLNVCGRLTRKSITANCDSDAYACFIEENGSSFTLARYISSVDYSYVENKHQVVIKYQGGDNCPIASKTAGITLNLFCELGAFNKPPIVIENDNCDYKIKWSTAAACPQIPVESNDTCKVKDPITGQTFDLSRLEENKSYKNTTDHYYYYLSLCGPQVYNPCNSIKASACRVSLSNETLSLGERNGSIEYFDGIITIKYEAENGKPRSELTLTCSHEEGKGFPSFINEKDNVYFFTWSTSYICPNLPIECRASFNGNIYDLSLLSRNDPGLDWKVFFKRKQIIYINICQSLTTSIAGCDPASAACLVDSSGKQIKSINLGRALTGPEVHTSGITLKYIYGDKCNSSSYSLVIRLICDVGNFFSAPKFIDMFDCEYTLIWHTNFACPSKKQIIQNIDCTFKDEKSQVIFNFTSLAGKTYSIKYGSTVYYISICKSLPDCNGSSATVCEKSDKSSTNTSIAILQNSTFEMVGEEEVVLIYNGVAAISEVLISFVCNASANMPEPTLEYKSDLRLLFEFHTPLACQPKVVSCQAVGDDGNQYDLSSITYTNENFSIIHDTRPDHLDLEYYVSICKPLTSVCKGTGASVCQKTQSGDYFDLGRAFSDLKVLSDKSLDLYFSGGSFCHKGQYFRSTRINFICDKEQFPPVFQDESSDCTYSFLWRTPAACPFKKAQGTACQITEPWFGTLINLKPLMKTTENYKIDNIILNICGPLNGITGPCQGQGVCLNQSISLGGVNDSLVYESNQLKLRFNNNDKKNSSEIIFHCYHENATGEEISLDPFIKYTFHFYTHLACPRIISTDCVIENNYTQYNLHSLSLMKSNYLVEGHSSSRKYFLNVCSNLVHSKETANCPQNSAVCLEIEDGNKKKFINVGEPSSPPIFEDNKLILKYETDDDCLDQAGKIKTIITFYCDEKNYDSSPELIEDSNLCLHNFIWGTPAACNSQAIKNTACTFINPQTGFKYDFSLLHKANGYNLNDSDGHQYTINVCGSVDCNGQQTGSCQRKLDKVWNAGLFNSDLRYEGGLLFLKYSDGQSCHNGLFYRSTIITFLCPEDGTASNSGPYFVYENEECSYYINWYTKFACEKITRPCMVQSGSQMIDLSSLTLTNGYHNADVTLDHSSIILNVCGPIKSTNQEPICEGAAACIVNKANPLNLGYASSSPKIDPISQQVILIYENGSLCSPSGKQASSKIVFLCNTESSFHGNPKLVSVVEDCLYIFVWYTYLVCPYNVKPSSSPCSYFDFKTQTYFNISLLQRKNQPYSIQVHKQYQYDFNLCTTLPGHDNDECQNAAVCRTNLITGEKMSFGHVSSQEISFNSNILKVKYSNGSACAHRVTGSATSEIWLKCSTNASETPYVLLTSDCSIVFFFPTHLACPFVSKECAIAYKDGLIDLSPLADKLWVVNRFKDKIYISLCQGIVPFGKSINCPRNATVCLVDDSNRVSVLGILDSQQLIEENGIVTLKYESEDDCDSGKTITTIEFSCGNGYGLPKYSDKSNKCQYVFEWKTIVACPEKMIVLKKNKQIVKDETGIFKFDIASLSSKILQQWNDYHKTKHLCLDCSKPSSLCFIDQNNCQSLGNLDEAKFTYEDQKLVAKTQSNFNNCLQKGVQTATNIIFFPCNRRIELGTLQILDNSSECLRIFNWPTKYSCQNFITSDSEPLLSIPNISPNRSPAKPGVVAAIVCMLIGVIVICVLAGIFHKEERRATCSRKIRNCLMRRGYGQPQYSYSKLSQDHDEGTMLLRNTFLDEDKDSLTDSDDDILT